MDRATFRLAPKLTITPAMMDEGPALVLTIGGEDVEQGVSFVLPRHRIDEFQGLLEANREKLEQHVMLMESRPCGSC